MKKIHYDGPVVLVVMDGVGLSLSRSGNAVRQAHTEFLDYALTHYLNIPLRASGEAVGILAGQMGNSEVGHNAIGSGQIIQQGIAQIEKSFATGDIWESKAWRGMLNFLRGEKPNKKSVAQSAAAEFWRTKAVQKSEKKSEKKPAEKTVATPPEIHSTLHFCGIFSDGRVHSDIAHLEKMIQRAYDEGVRKMRIHAIFDGRDVAPQSEPKYIERLEKFCKKFTDADIRIASGGGRMVMTADRYGNDWEMVKRGWDAMVQGKAARQFASASEAIKVLRRENPDVQDQYLPTFVIVENAAAASSLTTRAQRAKTSNPQKNAQPIGKIKDGDAVIYYDFRADRAIEIATAFTQKDFKEFARGRVPEIYFAGLTEYDADRHIPQNTLVPPIKISRTLNTVLGQHKLSQFAISETVKFGHITYYFNGNSYKKAPLEKHYLVDSYLEPFNSRPWMKSAEITDVALENLAKYDFVRINYPGGDMVGHFAELEPTIVAIEAIDLQLARLAKKVDELGGMMIVTADHGNAEELIDKNGTPKTAHTTNPVPCIFYDNTINAKKYHTTKIEKPGLANLAATIATLLGVEDYPDIWEKALIK